MSRYLAKNLKNSQAFEEQFSQNPHLGSFYESLKTATPYNKYNPHALPVQLYFLRQRIDLERTVDKETSNEKVLIVDRSIFEDNCVFAINQLESGMMNKDEYQQYLHEFLPALKTIRLPDLVVLLDLSLDHLLKRVRARGRDIENSLDKNYLESLQNHYERKLVDTLKELKVPVLFVKVDEQTEKLVPKQVTDKILELFNLEPKSSSIL